MQHNPTALFIDNEENFNFVRPMLEHTLGRPTLVHCKNNKEAVAFIHSDQYADIIFADWQLTGYRFMDSVRRDPENHNTPVIIMSEDTTIQHTVFNRINREETFFLPKPFLEKGLSGTYHQVLRRLERRRKTRLLPTSEHLLKVEINNSKSSSLPLVAISIDDCMFRVPVDVSHQMKMFDPAHVHLSIDEFSMKAQGEIYRISPDYSYPRMKASVLVTIMFNDSDRKTRAFQEMIDELGKRW